MCAVKVLPVVLVALSWLCAASVAKAETKEHYVLLPAAASTVGALLQVDDPLVGGQRLSAAIERDHVRVWVGAKEAPELSVTLRHRSATTFPTVPVGDTALVPEPGPVPAALLEQLANRIRKGEDDLPWVRPPASVHPQRQPVVLRGLLSRGRFDEAIKLLDATPDPQLCALSEAVRVLEEAGDWKQVKRFADLIRARSTDCSAAWAAALFARAHSLNASSALPLAQDAVASFGNRPLVLEAASAVFMRAARPNLAMQALYMAGSVDPDDPSRLRQLTAAVLAHLGGDPAARQAEERRLRTVLARTPGSPVARYVVGVLRHYEADFEESDRLLLPLAKSVGGDRLAVYLALNDFNQGRKEAALARLAAAMTPTADDPDVWYARAEILRDEDRKLAIADLTRYLRASGRSPFTSPEKRVRVRQLIAALEACERDGEARCAGPWEHPRAAVGEGPPTWLWPAAIGLLLLLIAGWWRRRKAT